MRALKRFLPRMLVIFLLLLAMTGVAYAWMSITAPLFSGSEDGYYQMAELKGELSTEEIAVFDKIEVDKTYEHKVVIRNTSENARAHLRAQVSWVLQETDGTQVGVPLGAIDARLEDSDDEWEWAWREKSRSWVREWADDGITKAAVLDMKRDSASGANEAEVTVKLTPNEGFEGYQADGRSLKVRVTVALEGELTYPSIAAISDL